MSRLHAWASGAASIALAASLGACSSSSGDTPERPGETGPSATEGTVARLKVRASVSRVLGELSQDRRAHFTRGAENLLRDYLAAAYLHQRPGDGYRGAFPHFTRDARELALRDVDITADRTYAGAERVRSRGAVVYLSVVAPEGKPVGATARVFLNLVVTEEGQATERLALRGRLLLTPAHDQWRIFGYDLSLEPTAPGRRS
jgi:hypothetical protein